MSPFPTLPGRRRSEKYNKEDIHYIQYIQYIQYIHLVDLLATWATVGPLFKAQHGRHKLITKSSWRTANYFHADQFIWSGASKFHRNKVEIPCSKTRFRKYFRKPCETGRGRVPYDGGEQGEAGWIDAGNWGKAKRLWLSKVFEAGKGVNLASFVDIGVGESFQIVKEMSPLLLLFWKASASHWNRFWCFVSAVSHNFGF